MSEHEPNVGGAGNAEEPSRSGDGRAPIEERAEVRGDEGRADPLDWHFDESVAVHEVRGEPRREPAKRDPWAHRRGEPRVFAFLWTMYVLVAVAGSVLWLATTGRFTATGYGPAARIMLVVVSAGVTLVWPMTRLSQQRPEGSVIVAAVVDVLVVLFPVQMVLWPLVFMAGWPASVVLAVAVQFLVWTVLIGGMIAVGLSAGDGARGLEWRLWTMVAVVGLVFAVPLFLAARAAAGMGHGPTWAVMCSPFTALPTTTGTGVSGPQAALTGVQRAAVVGVGVAATLVWGLAGFRAAVDQGREAA